MIKTIAALALLFFLYGCEEKNDNRDRPGPVPKPVYSDTTKLPPSPPELE